MANQRYPKSGFAGVATTIAAVVKANTDLPDGVTKGLACGTSGTVNLVDASGNDIVGFPLQQGYNPLSVIQVKTGGTATDIWALY
jgi:hypothetical protein